MPEGAFALSYFLKVRKLTYLTYCGVCGFAFDAYITTMDEYDAAMHFHRNSLCGDFYYEVAEIENENENENNESAFALTSFCDVHKRNLRSERPRFVPPFNPPCGYYGCFAKATMTGYVKLSR